MKVPSRTEIAALADRERARILRQDVLGRRAMAFHRLPEAEAGNLLLDAKEQRLARAAGVVWMPLGPSLSSAFGLAVAAHQEADPLFQGDPSWRFGFDWADVVSHGTGSSLSCS